MKFDPDKPCDGMHRYCAYRTGDTQINSPEFEGIKNQAGLNRFVLSVKQWVAKTNSKGIIAKINYRIHTDAIRENLNAVFINDGLEQAEHLTRLNLIAIQQMRILVEDRTTRKLEGSDE